MKSNKIIFLFLLVLNAAFSQESIDSTLTKVRPNKWFIEIGTGVSDGIRPYSEGYYSNFNNNLFNDFKLNSFTIGTRYNFSEIIGVKMDFAFDRFTNSTKNSSKPFEVAQYRTSLQGVINLNSLLRPKNDNARFHLLGHAGLHLAILHAVETNDNPLVGDGDNYGGIVYGITPMFRITKKTSVFVDLSSYTNYGQNLTWNGKHSTVSNNANGEMITGTLGLSFAID
jgi:OOP family OmpA-OmpF porin